LGKAGGPPLANASPPHTGSDSSQGSAMATPTPRSTVRRSIGELCDVMERSRKLALPGNNRGLLFPQRNIILDSFLWPFIRFLDRTMDLETKQKEEVTLLRNIAANLEKLEALLHGYVGEYEDPVYRFYHQSFKVYGLQESTEIIVEALQSLAPHLPLNAWFTQIVKEGTGKEFAPSDNEHWTEVTRPMVEAYFHARYFLEMVCTYGKELKEPPQVLPSGWAAVLYLYNLR